MKVAIILPRNMAFGPSAATAIDLCVHDIVMRLPADVTATVYAEDNVPPFTDLPDNTGVKTFPRRTWRQKQAYLPHIASALRVDKPDVIVVQQHLPSAAALARLLHNIPVVLHAHNFQWRGGGLKRLLQKHRYQRLAGIAFVSHACRDDFTACWPDIAVPTWVIPNGIDTAQWQPHAVRTNTISFVGRLTPDKGVLPFAQALAAVLPDYPDWRADLIFGESDKFPDYKRDVLAALQPIDSQTTIRSHQPYAAVKALYEHAAIAVVPSAYREAFGRVALEAMAGGAALISSTTGGLSEVVSNAALRLPEISMPTIRRALRALLDDAALRVSYAVRGRERVNDYTLHATVANFIEMCRAVMVR
jgi:glycosyltransferase involved in cell wall biosynthesis